MRSIRIKLSGKREVYYVLRSVKGKCFDVLSTYGSLEKDVHDLGTKLIESANEFVENQGLSTRDNLDEISQRLLEDFGEVIDLLTIVEGEFVELRKELETDKEIK